MVGWKPRPDAQQADMLTKTVEMLSQLKGIVIKIYAKERNEVQLTHGQRVHQAAMKCLFVWLACHLKKENFLEFSYKFLGILNISFQNIQSFFNF
jgi:hypothetical protein